MSAPVETLDDGVTRVVKVGPMGPYGNNAYIVHDVGTHESLLVDMPLETEDLLAAVEADGGVRRIIATHWHPDHWMSYDAVRTASGAPVHVGDREINIPAERIDGTLADGDEVRIGSTRVSVLISGDTLFNGGPGKTFARGELETLIRSIVDRLHPLDGDTVVMPGHGDNTTIAESRRQYAEYVKHPHAEGYYGDVEWLKGGA